jgi:hypothetical protein
MTTLQSLLNAITQEQLDRCHRIIDENTGKVFYKVQSESDPTQEYTVRFTEKGWSCTCPAGREGFRNCSHGTCKHCRWCHRHSQLLREEQREQAEITNLVNQGLDRDAAVRVVYANSHPYQWAPGEIEACERRYQARPFQLMR